MPDYDARLLLHTNTVTAWDVVCPDVCQGKSAEEWAPGTRLVFPYRGLYVHSAGGEDYVGEPNQVVFINEGQSYTVSHPVAGGDATLTVGIDPVTLLELTPREYRDSRDRPALNRCGLGIDARTQMLAAQLRQRLSRQSIGQLEAESRTLQLIRHTLGSTASRTALKGNSRREKMADQVKQLLSSDPWRRWTLAEIADEVGVAPAYLTDAFRRVEGVPLYRYHLRLRLVRALALLAEYDNLTNLALQLGFVSHSHFSAAFKQAFDQTPSEFRSSIHDQTARMTGDDEVETKGIDGAKVYLSRTVSGTVQKGIV